MKTKIRKGYVKKLKETLSNEKVIKDLENTRKKIRQKFALLKKDSHQNDQLNESFFSPVNREIREIASKITLPFIKREKSSEKTIKLEEPKIEKPEPKSEEDEEHTDNEDEKGQEEEKEDEHLEDQTISSFKSMLTDDETDRDTSDVEDDLTLIGKKEGNVKNEFVESLLNSYNSVDADYDRTYGPARDLSGEWHLGSEKFGFDHAHFKIGERKYEITPGLAKLIIENAPVEYNQKDLDQYKEILMLTNVHKRDYAGDSQVSGNRGYKYTNIIKKLIKAEKKPNKQQGKGLKNRFVQLSNKRTLVFYHDANQIVERLKLLLASESAGNTSHRNEIHEIIEELRTRKLIQ